MSVWQPGPRPEWVAALNQLGNPAWLSLDEAGLLEEAARNTGLDDFGDEGFREPLAIFLRALEDEAELNFVGRVLALSDVLNLLENRLKMTAARKASPEIANERIERPIFITGLPRTGTSVLHELLARDPANRPNTQTKWLRSQTSPATRDRKRVANERACRAGTRFSHRRWCRRSSRRGSRLPVR